MTPEQAATLKELAKAAYELDAFKPNLRRAEAELRRCSRRRGGRTMVGHAGHGARWNAGCAEPGRRKVAAYDLRDRCRGARGAVRDRNDAQYTMKTLRSRHTPHLNGWVRGRTLNDPLTNFSALC